MLTKAFRPGSRERLSTRSFILLLTLGLASVTFGWGFQNPAPSLQSLGHVTHSSPGLQDVLRLPDAFRQIESNQPLGFRGGVSYAIAATGVKMNAQEVLNSGPNSSGNIRLELWASPTPYGGGTISGYVLGSSALTSPSPNGWLTNVSQTATYEPPPPATYYIVLTLEQFSSSASSWLIADYFQFPGTQTLGFAADAATGSGNSGGFNILGPVHVTAGSSTVQIQAVGLQNLSVLAFSGLRLEVEATSVPYDQAGSYYSIALDPISATIGPAVSTAAIDDTVPLSPPPAGTYYLTLVLEQPDGSNWTTLTYVTLTGTVTLPVSGGVTAQPTSTGLTASATTAMSGTTVTFTAIVTSTAGIPNGTVDFNEGTTLIGSATVNSSGIATLSTSALPVGPQSVSAAFVGNSNWAASASNPVAITVTQPSAGPATLTASPGALPVGTLGVVTLTWSAPNSNAVEVHVGSTSGALFAEGGSSGSAATGQWATAGMIFYLIDANTRQTLTATTIQAAGSTATLTANPSALPAGVLATTNLTWSAPSSASVEIHIGSSSGTLFAEGGASGSAATGKWATAGMIFYLIDANTRQTLTATTIQAAGSTATLTANPGALPAGVLATTNLTWSAPSSASVEIHVGSSSGTLFAQGGSSGSAATGKWATAGMIFYLIDSSTRKLLASVTLASLSNMVTWSQQTELTASDGAAGDFFEVTSVDGNVAVVGAPKALNGNPAQGAAYVFAKIGGTWVQQAKLTEPDWAAYDRFGSSISVSGNTVVVGAWGKTVNGNNAQGAAYVFVQSAGNWVLQARLTASDGAALDNFGNSVSVSGDTIVVGASSVANGGPGAAYVFVESGGTWGQQAKLTASDEIAWDTFGSSVSVSGNTVVVGAMNKWVDGNENQGAAYVFVRSGGTWAQQAELTASDGAVWDNFGYSVSVSGNTIVVGEQGAVVNSKATQGAAYVFVASGGTWMEQAKLAAADGTTDFGGPVSVSGDTVVVGAPGTVIDGRSVGQGAVYVFGESGKTWAQFAKLTASDGTAGDLFGISVSVSGGTVLAAPALKAVNGNVDQGAVYVFQSNFSANPSTLPTGVLGTTVLTWNVGGSTAVEIHVDSPSGPLFVEGGSSGSAATGAWATAGTIFYLIDANTQQALAYITIGSSGGPQ